MPGQIIWRPFQALAQTWEGADLTLSDRVMDVDVYRGPYWLCRSSALLRGTYGTGDRAGWVVTGSTVTSQKSGIGLLKINWEVGGPLAPAYLLPLDDYREEAVELYPKVERNKYMYGASYPGNPNDRISSETIRIAYNAAHGSSPGICSSYKQQLQKMLTRTDAPPTGTTWVNQGTWGLQLLDWFLQGHETYYLAGIKYTYIRHFSTFPPVSLGGFIQSPAWGPRAGDTTLSWLRLADAPEPIGANGSVYKLTYAWLGGPGGHWNEILYAP